MTVASMLADLLRGLGTSLEIFADGTGAKIAEKYQIEPNALLLK